MAKKPKTAKFSLRLDPDVLARFHNMADHLDIHLSELFTVGALMVFVRASTPEEYMQAKADVFANAQREINALK